ncbi:MAG: hypothetical protein EB127_19230 [Alphaproteobacteria bacterium]|nr:hypothetical protein [Alphaproteobacteria bacterium]
MIYIALALMTYLLYNYRVGRIVSRQILTRYGSSYTHYLVYVQIGSDIYEKEVSKLDYYYNFTPGFTIVKVNYYKGLIYL